MKLINAQVYGKWKRRNDKRRLKAMFLYLVVKEIIIDLQN